ncbi:L-rhamnose isomerase [Candidatus Bathyarchaeota archaeon]|nr:L-rhamnose isomerase [Candidatus Bathyarchaeota archaeon]
MYNLIMWVFIHSYYCNESSVPIGLDWIKKVQKYEKLTLGERV